MPVRDWERIKTVFEQAKNIPEVDLGRALDSLCGGDPSMAAFVASLVKNDRDATAEVDPERDNVFSEGVLIGGGLASFVSSTAVRWVKYTKPSMNACING